MDGIRIRGSTVYEKCRINALINSLWSLNFID